MKRSPALLIALGVRTSQALMSRHDRIWSRYSHDKVDIGETVARILRVLSKALPLSSPLRALSIGSSTEPQFRLLEASFRGGLYLLDIEPAAVDGIAERVRRQTTTHVFPHRGDFTRILLDPQRTDAFRREVLGGRRVHFIALHHSLYYCDARHWWPLIENLYRRLLAPTGAIHCVLMSATTRSPFTTTRLYDRFAGKFFGHVNDQDLLAFGRGVRRAGVLPGARVQTHTNRVRFFVDDFAEFMSVVWMILLYPNVHRYTIAQRREITEYVYDTFFARRRPLLQDQDHLVIYRATRPHLARARFFHYARG